MVCWEFSCMQYIFGKLVHWGDWIRICNMFGKVSMRFQLYIRANYCKRTQLLHMQCRHDLSVSGFHLTLLSARRFLQLFCPFCNFHVWCWAALLLTQIPTHKLQAQSLHTYDIHIRICNWLYNPISMMLNRKVVDVFIS